MAKEMRAVTAHGIDLPVEKSLSKMGRTGLAFATINGSVIVTIVKGGEGLSAQLDDDMIDHVAGLFATIVTEATAQLPPERRTIQ